MARRTRRRRGGRGRARLRLDGTALAVGAVLVLAAARWLRDHPAVAYGAAAVTVLLLAGWVTRGRWGSAVRLRTRTGRSPLALSPSGFERHIADLLTAAGHTHVAVSGGAGDLGADVVSRTRTGQRVVVQCKRYGPRNPVGSGDMQRFVGTARPHHGADIALFVTTSRFTRPAADYARTHQVFTIDGAGLEQWRRRGAPTWLA
ncbi:restriction endonuclease [Streptomyces sp. Z26]|uniref:restriction endonuclease n=1 Tax=Streptomyces sp. Z26 TaxID=2500177 RepID=UPI000EF16139|nr:restriction endonuclease [Streptomyces sp. Z26]RLL67004.1 restriction endonuclease [Streptomyces sp. Z26]